MQFRSIKQPAQLRRGVLIVAGALVAGLVDAWWMGDDARSSAGTDIVGGLEIASIALLLGLWQMARAWWDEPELQDS